MDIGNKTNGWKIWTTIYMYAKYASNLREDSMSQYSDTNI